MKKKLALWLKTAVIIYRKLNTLGHALVWCALALPVVIILVAAWPRNGAAAASDASPAPVEILASAMPTPVLTAAATPSPSPTPTPDPTLRKGMESAAVAELQQRLIDLGYLDTDEPTEYFGSATRAAVKLFQRQCELSEDGVAGVETLARIYADDAPRYTMMEGMEGTDIDSLQRQLIALGYMSRHTGYYGELTIEAIKKFQTRNDLTADGLAGVRTINLLYSPDAKMSAEKEAEERRSANISTMISTAKKMLGKPYILGNEGPNSFDCSGLVYYCLKAAGSNRGRYNARGYAAVSDWDKITSMSKLKKGDLLFFYTKGTHTISHVGIYIGDGMMIDASFSNSKVVKRSCTSSYWKSVFAWARRPW